MGITRRTRIWTSVGTAALLGGLAGCSEPAPQDDTPVHTETPAPASQPAAPNFSEGEGEGEGEGGGGGGEFGIDPEAAASDPVVYNIALEVMCAHYLAGIDAFQAGDRTAGAEMFAHPISEIYIDFEPVLETLGAPLFGETLTAASVAPYAGESDAEIAAKVEAVIVAIDEAAAFAPAGGSSAGATHARVLADLFERAALQYRVVADGAGNAGAYLDGYGFAKAAERYAANHLADISALNPNIGDGFQLAVNELARAYPQALLPESLPADPDMLLAAADQLKLVAITLP